MERILMEFIGPFLIFTHFRRSSLKLVIMEKPGRSSRMRRHPARISLISLNVFGDDKKLLDVSPGKEFISNHKSTK